MRSSSVLIVPALGVVALGLLVSLGGSTTSAQIRRDTARVEGVIISVGFNGADAQIGLRVEEGTIRQVKIRGLSPERLPFLVDLMNNGNRVAYELRDNEADGVMPALLMPRAPR